MSANSLSEKLIELLSAGRLSETVELLRSLPSHEVVEALLRLSSGDRTRLLTVLDLDTISEELAKLPVEIIHEIARVKGLDDIVKVIKKLPVDEIADIVAKLPHKMRIEVLRSIPGDLAQTVAKLAKFPPESVGGVMTTMVPVFSGDLAVGNAIEEYIHKSKQGLYESSHYVYVVDHDGKLIGYTDVKTLLTKPRDTKLSKCTLPVKVTVTPFDDREVAAKVAINYDLMEVPVVDFDGRFIGIVTLDDLLDVVVSEYSEDLLKYAGFVEAVKGSYVTENPLKLALKRVPVLIYLYLVNTITGSVVASFTTVIERVAVLAAFMPMLADNSGNIGAQASALVLRGLVTGEIRLSRRDLAMLLIKEFTATTVMITILAPIAFAIGFLIPFLAVGGLFSAIRVASVVAIALVVSCYVADVVGAFLPVVLAKLRIDPATASAPLVTSIADIITVTVYFMTAALLFMV
ncbi:MAG: magnesium transporter [Desulfurococcaceae archaeon]